MKLRILFSILLLIALSGVSNPVSATPTQYGISGLLNQPSADTLESGNISAGLWLISAGSQSSDATTILPFSLTMGLGSFIESYGSFPNLLLNEEEESSGRGFANLGFKIRFLGQRSSPYKMALDLQARRHISADAERDGAMEMLARVIGTFKKGRYGLHLNAGYLKNDEKLDFDDQFITGAGIEYFPFARLRLIAELEGSTSKGNGYDPEADASLGLQYFYSPHLTLHAGFSVGLTDSSEDWRVITGVSTSQGIGTFTKPVPRIIEPVLPEKEPEEKEKSAKFKTITPLLPMSRLSKPAPMIKSELPVNPGEEKVLVEPENQLKVSGDFLQETNASPVSSPAPELSKSRNEHFQATKPINTVVYRKFRFDDVNFAFDQHSLSEAGAEALAQIANSLQKENKWFLIRINGHTDSIGSFDYNEKLSYQRAASVGQQFVAQEGFDPARIFIKGFGETQPIASNNSPEGRSQNRRAEILVLLPEKGE